jgi:hypothetical protein
MANEQHKTFIGEEYDLIFYTGKPLVEYEIECENATFSGQVGYTLKIWEDGEDGRQLLSLVQGNGLRLSGTSIFISASSGQMDIEPGRYYYELSYLVSGGYEILVKYGLAKFIGRQI